MTSAASQRWAGTLFDDRYELRAYLGGGQSGEVWEALDKHRGHLVALKILENARESEVWREATHLTSLSRSPYILTVNNAAVAIDVPYIDTALAVHGTAEAAAGPRGMPARIAVSMTRNLLAGLSLCHGVRLVHRDVKPANLFLTANGDAQLGDFGLVARMDIHGHVAVGGDPDIRAPEVLKGGPCTTTSDVYSAGLTLRALLVGSLPHSIVAAGTFAAHKANVLAGSPDIHGVAPHLPLALAQVVRKATAADPSHRYQTAAQMDTALAGLQPFTLDVTEASVHPGHVTCFAAIRVTDGHEFTVCAVPNGSGVDVDVRHALSGHQVHSACASARTPGQAPVALRKAFRTIRPR